MGRGDKAGQQEIQVLRVARHGEEGKAEVPDVPERRSHRGISRTR